MSFLQIPINPDAECLLHEFDAYVTELDQLHTLILLDRMCSISDMEQRCRKWDAFMENLSACQTEATEKHIALPLTAAIGKKGDLQSRGENCGGFLEVEEEHQRVEEEEEEITQKAAEEEELARKTSEAATLTHKIVEAGKETAGDNGDGEEDGESSEAGEKTGDIIVIKQKLYVMTTLVQKGKKAKAIAAAAAPAPTAGGSRTSRRKAMSDCTTIVSEDEDVTPRARPGPGK
ncbi:uncharacterized protein F5147DRAFT_658594 [Suillus discolor]|uniref:Uncharacterized protein n=1 Tax=Suillus discolor TaxID=1912936 RepID=A0A9P7ESP9_9AGAM|nr:uncharacterized protein F5147DRAFT_658594 [Suillus discolor]KAG2088848.1 hypothetical protein F5147DRAFT_658594 [Suillus discolor]